MPPKTSPKDTATTLFESILYIAGLMGAVFTVLEVFLPSSLIQPVGAVVAGAITVYFLYSKGYIKPEIGMIVCSITIVILVLGYELINRPATISGQIIDPNSIPVSGLSLILTNSNGIDQRVVTDHEGRFEIRNVPDGRYTIVTDANKLLYSGEVASGLQRLFSPQVNTGSLPFDVQAIAVTLATPTPDFTPTLTAIPDTPTPDFTPTLTPILDTSTPDFTPTSPRQTQTSLQLAPTLTPIPDTPTSLSIPPLSTAYAGIPTEIPVNKILFAEDFEGNTINSGFSRVQGEVRIIQGSNAYQLTTLGSFYSYKEIQFGSRAFTNYRFVVDVNILSAIGEQLTFSLGFRHPGAAEYTVAYSAKDKQLALNYVSQDNDWRWEYLASANITLNKDTWYTIEIEANHDIISVFVNGQLQITHQDNRISAGRLELTVGPESNVAFDNILVTSLD